MNFWKFSGCGDLDTLSAQQFPQYFSKNKKRSVNFAEKLKKMVRSSSKFATRGRERVRQKTAEPAFRSQVNFVRAKSCSDSSTSLYTYGYAVH